MGSCGDFIKHEVKTSMKSLQSIIFNIDVQNGTEGRCLHTETEADGYEHISYSETRGKCPCANSINSTSSVVYQLIHCMV